jgi:hypothetical protein
MNPVTSLLAAASSDEHLINTIDRVAGKGASWWLAGIGVLLLAALGFLFRAVIIQNRDLMQELRDANASQAKDLREVITANTVAMTNMTNALASTSSRLDNLEDAINRRP